MMFTKYRRRGAGLVALSAMAAALVTATSVPAQADTVGNSGMVNLGSYAIPATPPPAFGLNSTWLLTSAYVPPAGADWIALLRHGLPVQRLGAHAVSDPDLRDAVRPGGLASAPVAPKREPLGARESMAGRRNPTAGPPRQI